MPDGLVFEVEFFILSGYQHKCSQNSNEPYYTQISEALSEHVKV